MKAYSVDDHWELLKCKYEGQGQPLPRGWLWLYRIVRALLRWGAR